MEATMEKKSVKKIPRAKGLPVLGNTLQLMKNPLDFCIDQYHKLGDIYQIKTVFADVVVFAGLEANQFLSRSANDLLSSEKVWGPFSHEINAERSLVSLDGKEHAQLRRIMMPGYSPAALMDKEQETIDLTKKILDKVIDKGPIPVVNFFKNMVVEVVGNLTSGMNPGDYTPYLIYYLRVLLNVHVVRMWPKIMLQQPKFKKAKKKVIEFSKIVMDNYSKRSTDSNRKKDLVDDIMDAVREGKLDFTEDELRFAIIGPFFAGIDTVANNCSNLLWAYIENPEVLKRVREEMDPLFLSGEGLTMKDMRKMETMLNVVMETLRKYPVTPIVHRTAAVDFEYNGYEVKKGQDIYMAQGVTHFLDTVFKEPNKFDIDRFAEGREEHKLLGALSPYGFGAHKCLGFRLNEVLTILVMGYFAHYVDFELSPKDYKLTISTLPTPGPDDKFKVKFTKRKL